MKNKVNQTFYKCKYQHIKLLKMDKRETPKITRTKANVPH